MIHFFSLGAFRALRYSQGLKFPNDVSRCVLTFILCAGYSVNPFGLKILPLQFWGNVLNYFMDASSSVLLCFNLYFLDLYFPFLFPISLYFYSTS